MSLISTSVIIPCYNGLPFVFEAVQSVLDQADDAVECVVIDDGSKDGSADQVEQRFGGRVRVVRQANAGASAARNRGLAETKGELVIWLDADDRLPADTLAQRRRAFVDDPQLEMLVGMNLQVNPETGWSALTNTSCGPDFLTTDLLHCRNVSRLNAMTFRRSALARVGEFDTTLPPIEDVDFWMRAWAELRWRFVPVVYSWQRIGSYPSLTRTVPALDTYLKHLRMLENNRGLMVARGAGWTWRREAARWIAKVALCHLVRGDRHEARRWALRAIGMALGCTELRTYRFLLESLLPPSVYRLGAELARYVLPPRWPARAEGTT